MQKSASIQLRHSPDRLAKSAAHYQLPVGGFLDAMKRLSEDAARWLQGDGRVAGSYHGGGHGGVSVGIDGIMTFGRIET